METPLEEVKVAAEEEEEQPSLASTHSTQSTQTQALVQRQGGPKPRDAVVAYLDSTYLAQERYRSAATMLLPCFATMLMAFVGLVVGFSPLMLLIFLASWSPLGMSLWHLGESFYYRGLARDLKKRLTRQTVLELDL
jgi:hypothetical protein